MPDYQAKDLIKAINHLAEIQVNAAASHVTYNVQATRA